MLDDTNLFYAEENIILLDTVNIELQKISQWFISNKLSLNVIKNYSFFHKLSKKYSILLLLPKLNILCNDKIKQSESIKFIGVFLHQNLIWQDHINYAKNKIAKNIGLLFRPKPYL